MFFPMTLVLGMLVIGLFFLLLTRRQKTGKILVLIGTVLLGLMSYDGISGGILRPLEYNYPPILNVQNIQTLKWVVVLEESSKDTEDQARLIQRIVGIEKAERAFYEYLGLAWAKLCGLI